MQDGPPGSGVITPSTTSSSSKFPGKLRGGTQVCALTLKDVPTSDALEKWLSDQGVDTREWGHGNFKSAKSLWKEISLGETVLELWREVDGTLQPLRVTHVLRAKVTSTECYSRNIFCFNTWQQYGDGRKRTRNGLLSEKVGSDELPIEDNLHAVCQRAMGEEMGRIVEAAVMVRPGVPAPEFNPTIKSGLTVMWEKFVDSTVEVEESKSFPGLSTMYRLYTVEIVCSGLPVVDFNTLEFNAADQAGRRTLKYIHAWAWVPWLQLQRYLFDGSKLLETKKRGSFESVSSTRDWLSQFDIDLRAWGRESYKSVQALLDEMEKEQTHLELWGRHDGVPLLMRVVHVVQLTVSSTDPALSGKFLLKTGEQLSDGTNRPVNRLLAKKLRTGDSPFDEARFTAAAKEAVREELTSIVDAHYQTAPGRQIPRFDTTPDAGVHVLKATFVDSRFDLEDSPSYKGIHTMYHLYRMEVECEGLPSANFGSIEFKINPQGDGLVKQVKCVNSWRWVTWQEALDRLHEQKRTLETRDASTQRSYEDQRGRLQRMHNELSRLSTRVQQFVINPNLKGPQVEVGKRLSKDLQLQLATLQVNCLSDESEDFMVRTKSDQGLAATLPPTMVSATSQHCIASREFLESAQAARYHEASKKVIQRVSFQPDFDDTEVPVNIPSSNTNRLNVGMRLDEEFAEFAVLSEELRHIHASNAQLSKLLHTQEEELSKQHHPWPILPGQMRQWL